MVKPDWGVKRTCPSCEARFYDLQREPVLCPECGATFNVDDRGKVSGVRERRAPVPVGDEEDAIVDDEDLAEDADADEDEQDALLAEDDEDEEPAGPALADEDEEGAEAAPFEDPGLIDDELDEDSDDEDGVGDDEIDVDDVPDKGG